MVVPTYSLTSSVEEFPWFPLPILGSVRPILQLTFVALIPTAILHESLIPVKWQYSLIPELISLLPHVSIGQVSYIRNPITCEENKREKTWLLTLGLYSFLERQTRKQQLEYNRQNESLYRFQCSVRHKEHTNLALGRGRKGVGRGAGKASQRRWFDHVFTQTVTCPWKISFYSRPAQRPTPHKISHSAQENTVLYTFLIA